MRTPSRLRPRLSASCLLAGSLSLLSLLCVVLACAAPAAAQATPAAPAPARQTATIGPYRYLTFVTGGARPDDRLPMIIGLHYSSATPERVASDFDAIGVPARIVLPQGRYPRRDGFSWFSSTYANLDAAAQRAETFRVTDELSTFVTPAAIPGAPRP